jgi:hypothetical protein
VTENTDRTAYSSSGDTTETNATWAHGGALIEQTVPAASANGALMTTDDDFKGDEIVDLSTMVQKPLNSNGSQAENVANYLGAVGGAMRDVTTTTSGIVLSGRGQETTTVR